MVTNGPLLRPNVRGQLPGFVFTAPAGEEISLGVSLSLSIRDPVSYLEIIRNGEVERSVPLEEWSKSGTLAPLSFKESGWFLIRAVTDVETTYRFASTGPYYVEIGDQTKRISRVSSQFFLEWTRQRYERVRSSPSFKPGDLTLCEQAIQYWENLVRQSNAP